MDTKKTEERLNYYFTFDYLPSSNKSNSAIEKLFDELSLGKGKTRNLTEENSNKKYHSFSLFLSTLLAKTRLDGSKHCYRSLMRGKFTGEPVSYRHFQDFKAAMLQHGYLHHEKGRFHEDEDAHFFQTEEEIRQGKKEYVYYSASKFFVSDKLVIFCNDNGIDANTVLKHFTQLKPKIFIEARYPSKRIKVTKIPGRKVRKADLYQMAEANAQQSVMYELNDFLFAQKLTGAVFTGLKRVYNDYTNDGSYNFSKGGRLYAFEEDNYQRLSKEERAKIKINGEKTCEIDIHASFLTILHGILDKPLPNRANLYDITDLPKLVVKSWINNSISMGHPIVRWPKKTLEDFSKDLPGYKFPTAPTVGREIQEYYPLIGDLKAAGLDWRRLHNIEGNIVLNAVRRFQGLGIPALPVHDSLIVPRQHKQQCVDMLSECFQELTGIIPILK